MSAINKGLEVIEKVADINEVTQQCKEYFFSLKRTMDQPGPLQNPEPSSDIVPNFPATLDTTMMANSTVESQLLDQQSSRTGADLFSADWNDMYGAAGIFKDPLLPEFSFNWLDL